MSLLKATIIPECVPLLVLELEKLNKKAAKLGCQPLTHTVSDPYLRSGRNNQVDEVVDVEVFGEPIKLNGWRFLGRIEAVENQDNLIFGVPGETMPDSYRKSSPYLCEHCGQNRQRKFTWLLQHDTGAYKQVGSSCMDDFLSAKSPEKAVAWWMTSLKALTDYLQDLAKREPTYHNSQRHDYKPVTLPAALAVSYACQVVRERGKYEFCSEETRGTTNYVWELMFHGQAKEIDQQDHDMGDKIIAYILARRYDSDYFKNLSIMLIANEVEARHLNYVVSSVYTYHKAHGSLPGKAKRLNEHYGTVGDRARDLELTVTLVHPITSKYHDTYDYLVIMTDLEGRTYKWKKTSAGNLLHKEDKVKVTGTIVEHEVYNGTKQTVLSRCKVEVLVETA